MDPTTSVAGAPPPPTVFDNSQKLDLERLWETQTRPIQDVLVTPESTSGTTRKETVNGLALTMLGRLHSFFVAFLQNAVDVMNTQQKQQQNLQEQQEEERRRQANGNNGHSNNVLESPGDSDEVLSDQKDPNEVENDSETTMLKPPGGSCLAAYAGLYLRGGSLPSETTTVKLRGGSRLFTIHYDEFMSELNRFEFRGDASAETLRKHSFAAFLHHFPLEGLPAVNVAMALAVLTLWKIRRDNGALAPQIQHEDLTKKLSDAARLEQFLDTCKITVRFVHVTPQLPMADIKTGLVKKFISVKGHVVKARPKRLRVATADFVCQKCSTNVPYAFEQGRYSFPKSCTSPSCRSRSFSIVRPTARYVNVQTLRLQEAQEESTNHAGRTPRQIEVELAQDLIDSCRPGDIVLLACYVDAINTAVAAGRAGRRAQEATTYKLFLQGHSITTLSESSNNQRHRKEGSQYTQQQLRNITQLCHADHRCLNLIERRAFPFDLLVQSLCPSIIGHHAVKAGILLCLLGGTPPAKQQVDRGNSIRSNSHILIVGDPGMGKSQMLNAATQLAARSVYVGGNTASTTGLTVTLTKEESGETGIEAGALVLADQGVACIDELDKCKHLDGLLEAMEQQQVSIAKAGVVASLPARCSVIAAANPKDGNYNMSKAVAENLNISRPILSRFDLVFILRDRADKDHDRLVSSNIMNLYRTAGSRSVAGPGGAGAGASSGIGVEGPITADLFQNGSANKENHDGSTGGGGGTTRDDARVPMEKRLAWVSTFNGPLPAGLVRDYIAYAREFCKPKLTQEASLILKDYYMNLRYPSDGKNRRDTVPITTRQLEALIRLSQARAKACLREYVLREDALDVVDLLRRSVEQVHTDEFGTIDRSRGGAGGQSNRKTRVAFTKELYHIVGPGADCTLDDLRRIADRVACSLSEFQTMIDDMRDNGILMKKPDGRYRILS